MMKNFGLSVFVLLVVSGCLSKSKTTANGAPEFSIRAADVSSAIVQIVTNRPDMSATRRSALVDVRFSSKAAAEFRKFTREHLNQHVRILVGYKVVASPWIRAVIPAGEIELTFSTPEEAQLFADALTKK